DASIMLAAVAYPENGTVPGERSLRLLLAMLSSADAGVLAGHDEALEEDAAFELTPGDLTLDTARYDLAPGVRAIGLVVLSSARGPSCPDGGRNDQLTLCVRHGRASRPVFEQYLSRWIR